MRIGVCFELEKRGGEKKKQEKGLLHSQKGFSGGENTDTYTSKKQKNLTPRITASCDAAKAMERGNRSQTTEAKDEAF